MALAWVLFAGSHLVLSSSPLRDRLSERFGEPPFVAVYAVIAATTASIVAVTAALVGSDGSAPPLWLANDIVRWIAWVLAALGAIVMVNGLIGYPTSPVATASARRRDGAAFASPVRRRLVNHPFFAGLAMLSAAHLAFASTLASATFFLGFVALCLAGIALQDRKLRHRYGAAYRKAYERGWSMPSTREIVATGLATALLALLHPLWAASNGGAFMGLVVVGGSLAVASRLKPHWRKRESSAASTRSDDGSLSAVD